MALTYGSLGQLHLTCSVYHLLLVQSVQKETFAVTTRNQEVTWDEAFKYTVCIDCTHI